MHISFSQGGWELDICHLWRDQGLAQWSVEKALRQSSSSLPWPMRRPEGDGTGVCAGTQQAYIELHFWADIWRSFTIPNCLCGEKALPREVVLPPSLNASEIKTQVTCSDFIAGTMLNRMLPQNLLSSLSKLILNLFSLKSL